MTASGNKGGARHGKQWGQSVAGRAWHWGTARSEGDTACGKGDANAHVLTHTAETDLRGSGHSNGASVLVCPGLGGQRARSERQTIRALPQGYPHRGHRRASHLP